MAFFGCKKDDSVSGQGDTNGCFYFEAVDAGAVVSMVKYADYGDSCKAPDVSLEYSLNKSNWSPFVVGETSVRLNNAGDRVYIRAIGKNDSFGSRYYSEERDVWAYHNFSASERVKVGGNIMYLLDETGSKKNFDTLSNKYVFYSLFLNMDKLTDASKLSLPAKTLAEFCYESMFYGCASLTVAPELPATTLAKGCYCGMFYRCTSLIVAPELPAKTLAENCYNTMFTRCKSLTVAPELPAKTLAEHCYFNMFLGCTSLTAAPELPATTLAEYCYYNMFSECTSLTVAPKMLATTLAVRGCYEMFEGCSSLQSIEVNFTEWTEYGTTSWLQGVSATGTFTCPAELDVTKRGGDRIPEGWTIVTK